MTPEAIYVVEEFVPSMMNTCVCCDGKSLIHSRMWLSSFCKGRRWSKLSNASHTLSRVSSFQDRVVVAGYVVMVDVYDDVTVNNMFYHFSC